MREALKLALEYLYDRRMGGHVIAAIKEALANHIEDNLAMVAQPEKEPVGKVVDCNELGYPIVHFGQALFIGTLLYTTPPQRTWVGLTDEEMHECAGEYPWTPTGLKCCRAIEAKLKEKNT